MPLDQISAARCFGGVQATYRHRSRETGTDMRLSVFHPPAVAHGPVPVVWWLSGLTCTEETFPSKAGAQRVAAELGLMLVAPDTSPRGPATDGSAVPDDPDHAYDFGLGAGFYVDATQAPWRAHYRMWSYVSRELPQVVGESLPDADLTRQSVAGHSMGGHGALTLALQHPLRFRGVSAFAPICAPSQVSWGRKALGGYLGLDREAWREHDAVALIEDGARLDCPILIDQGEADPHLADQLRPDLLEAACAKAGLDLTLRRRPGYEHGYLFVATFIEEHLRWHAERLGL